MSQIFKPNIIKCYLEDDSLVITQKVIIIFTSLLLLILLFQNAIESIVFGGQTTIINQICVLSVLGIAIYIQLSKYSLEKYFLLLGLILIYLISISLIFGKNNSVFQITAQSFLHVQLFIILLSLYVINKEYPGFSRQIFIFSILVSIVGVILQLIIPSQFTNIFTPSDQVLSVLDRGTLRIWGFQTNPNRIGVLFSIFLVLLMYKEDIVPHPKRRFLLISISLLIVILSGSRSALIFLVIGLFFSDIKIKKKIFFIVFLVLALSIFGLIDYLSVKTASNIENLSEVSVDESKYIRWLMFYHGTGLAIQNFPIGTGAATFGTALSANSPVYYEVGIANLPSVSEGRGIHDSNYGSIMGEFGFLGFLVFYGFLSYLVLSSKKVTNGLYRVNSKQFLITILLICFVATFMRPLFSSSYYSVIIALSLFSDRDYRK